MNKQDSTGVRTAADLEKKYDFSGMQKAIKSSEVGIQRTNDELLEFLEKLGNLQEQVDGQIATWYGNGIPTMDNYPVNEWPEEDYEKHLEDLYYDMDAGYPYRFILQNGAYKWVKLDDDDLSNVLAIAAHAKDTADGKRRVFITDPIPPYESGDLWLKNIVQANAAGGHTTQTVLYRCQTSKKAGENYAEGDFILAVDYATGNELQKVDKKADDIKETMNDSHVIYKGDCIYVVDKLPKEAATHVIMIDSKGISFSDEGIEGPYNSAWTIDGTFDAQQTNIINLSADQIDMTGAITWEDLDPSNQTKINDAKSAADAALGGLENCVRKTYIDGKNVITESLEASNLTISGGKVQIDSYGSSSGAHMTDDVIRLRNINGGDVTTVKISPNACYSYEGDSASSMEASRTGVFKNQLYENGDTLQGKYATKTYADSKYAPLSHSHPEYANPSVSYLAGYPDDVILTSNFLRPRNSDGDVYLGGATHRWSAVYATVGQIKTSDRRQKHCINGDMDKYIAVLDKIKPVSYVLDSDAEEKSHVGYIAQDVWKAIKDCGLKDEEFAGFVRDMQADGPVYTYGLIYDEFIPIIHAKLKKLEKRIDELEQLLEQKSL